MHPEPVLLMAHGYEGVWKGANHLASGTDGDQCGIFISDPLRGPMSGPGLIEGRCKRPGRRSLSIVKATASMPTCGITAATGVLWGNQIV